MGKSASRVESRYLFSVTVSVSFCMLPYLHFFHHTRLVAPKSRYSNLTGAYWIKNILSKEENHSCKQRVGYLQEHFFFITDSIPEAKERSYPWTNKRKQTNKQKKNTSKQTIFFLLNIFYVINLNFNPYSLFIYYSKREGWRQPLCLFKPLHLIETQDS